MKMIVSIALASFSLGGCATVGELVDDPSVEHSTVVQGHQILTLREDNRLVRSTYTVDGRLRICAETQPDAISTRSSRSGIEVTGKGGVEDAIERELMLTYARTEISDVVRQLAWQLCNANLNGQLSNTSYENSLRALQNQAMAVLDGQTETDPAKALELMNDLASRAAESAAADRAHELTLEQERTKQATEATQRDRIAACRSIATTNAELAACVSGGS